MRRAFILTLLALALLGPSPGAGVMGCGGPTGPSSLSTTEDFIARLREAGASVQRMGQVGGAPLFSVPGTVLSVNDPQPRVVVYEYATAQQAAEEVARVASRSVTISWVATPHIYQAGRLVVSYVGISQQILRLLGRILGTPVFSDPHEYDHLSSRP